MFGEVARTRAISAQRALFEPDLEPRFSPSLLCRWVPATLFCTRPRLVCPLPLHEYPRLGRSSELRRQQTLDEPALGDCSHRATSLSADAWACCRNSSAEVLHHRTGLMAWIDGHADRMFPALPISRSCGQICTRCSPDFSSFPGSSATLSATRCVVTRRTPSLGACARGTIRAARLFIDLGS